MACQIIFSTLAAKEIQKSFEWYENLQPGLGSRFISFVDQIISVVELYPECFPCKRNRFREASVKKFPYLLVYEFLPEERTVFILHVFHTPRHPSKKFKKR